MTIPPNFKIVTRLCASCEHCLMGDPDEPGALCDLYGHRLHHILHVCESWTVNTSDAIYFD